MTGKSAPVQVTIISTLGIMVDIFLNGMYFPLISFASLRPLSDLLFAM